MILNSMLAKNKIANRRILLLILLFLILFSFWGIFFPQKCAMDILGEVICERGFPLRWYSLEWSHQYTGLFLDLMLYYILFLTWVLVFKRFGRIIKKKN